MWAKLQRIGAKNVVDQVKQVESVSRRSSGESTPHRRGSGGSTPHSRRGSAESVPSRRGSAESSARRNFSKRRTYTVSAVQFADSLVTPVWRRKAIFHKFRDFYREWRGSASSSGGRFQALVRASVRAVHEVMLEEHVTVVWKEFYNEAKARAFFEKKQEEWNTDGSEISILDELGRLIETFRMLATSGGAEDVVRQNAQIVQARINQLNSLRNLVNFDLDVLEGLGRSMGDQLAKVVRLLDICIASLTRPVERDSPLMTGEAPRRRFSWQSKVQHCLVELGLLKDSVTESFTSGMMSACNDDDAGTFWRQLIGADATCISQELRNEHNASLMSPRRAKVVVSPACEDESDVASKRVESLAPSGEKARASNLIFGGEYSYQVQNELSVSPVHLRRAEVVVSPAFDDDSDVASERAESPAPSCENARASDLICGGGDSYQLRNEHSVSPVRPRQAKVAVSPAFNDESDVASERAESLVPSCENARASDLIRGGGYSYQLRNEHNVSPVRPRQAKVAVSPAFDDESDVASERAVSPAPSREKVCASDLIIARKMKGEGHFAGRGGVNPGSFHETLNRSDHFVVGEIGIKDDGADLQCQCTEDDCSSQSTRCETLVSIDLAGEEQARIGQERETHDVEQVVGNIPFRQTTPTSGVNPEKGVQEKGILDSARAQTFGDRIGEACSMKQNSIYVDRHESYTAHSPKFKADVDGHGCPHSSGGLSSYAPHTDALAVLIDTYDRPRPYGALPPLKRPLTRRVLTYTGPPPAAALPITNESHHDEVVADLSTLGGIKSELSPRAPQSHRKLFRPSEFAVASHQPTIQKMLKTPCDLPTLVGRARSPRKRQTAMAKANSCC